MSSERRLIIVSGLSGAGKSVALHALEDLDYYCVDNLPVSFLPELVRQLDAGELPHIEAAAVGIDSRGSAAAIRSLPGVLEQLEAQISNLTLNLADEKHRLAAIPASKLSK